MMKEIHKKRDGFVGQKAIVLPALINKNETDPILQNLMITDIGYYPNAHDHYRSRAKGIDEHIFIYCVNGNGRCKMGGKEYQIKNDEYLIIPANKQHVYAADKNNPWTIYWLHFKGSFSGAIAQELFDRLEKKSNNIHYSEKRIKVFDELFDNLERGTAKQNLAFISLSLSYFLSSFLYQECFNLNETTQVKDNPIELSISHMKQKIEILLSLNALAEIANLSPSHYSYLFKQHTGYSPIEYFNRLKIQKACQWLQFTELHINEVSYKLGINDVFYFSRLFKKIMGTSPKHYRLKWKPQGA
ncbi:helix-turn-helix domain-containing protein [Chitinophaga sp. MM2321]|uniref:AraC family transcriptional regulator n=1 Tax=Chitinophaga sp. MM2321 TaxID=3137178 RepID=UPI0032D58FB4